MGLGMEKKKNGGFTMIEVLAVAAIILVLIALGFAEAARNSRLLKVTELDNMAREIYLAAEGRAEQLTNSGRLKASVGKACEKKDEGGEKKPVAVGADTGVSRKWYIKYPADPDATADVRAALEELLPEGVIDPGLRDGFFYIVYDVVIGCVTDVFYADKPKEPEALDELSKALANAYLGSSSDFAGFCVEWTKAEDDSENANHAKTSRATRADEKVYIGHYCGNATVPAPVELLSLPVPKINVVNGEEMVLEISFDAGVPDGSDLKVTLAYGEYRVELNQTTDARTKYTWTLDTLKEGGRQFKDLGWKRPDGTDASGLAFGKDFTVNARLEKAGHVTETAAPKKYNSLFADGSGDGGRAYIEYLRHLQNLDKAFSGVGGKTEAYQRKSIDAKDAKDDAGAMIKENYAFRPIQNDELKLYKSYSDPAGSENYNVISNLKVTAASAAGKSGVGLFAEAAGVSDTDRFKFENVRLVNASVAADTIPIGGIVGKAENADFTNCRVYWEKTPNPTAPTDLSKYDYHELKNGTDVNYKILGTNAGGLAGELKGGTLTNSLAATTVKGSVNTGGLIGSAGGTVKVYNSYADCYLKGPSSTAGNIGGLVGIATAGSNVTMKNVYAAGFAEKAARGGGLVGAGGVGTGGSVEYAYAAVYYDNSVGSAVPLADSVAPDSSHNRYFLRYSGCSWISGTPTGTNLSVLTITGGAFEATRKTEAAAEADKRSIPYNLPYPARKDAPTDTVYSRLGDYDFPGLAGMPHYGDWKVDVNPTVRLEIINGDELLVRVSSSVKTFSDTPTVELTYHDTDGDKIVNIPTGVAPERATYDASGVTVYTWTWTLDTLKTSAESNVKFKDCFSWVGWQKRNAVTGNLEPVAAPAIPGRDFSARVTFNSGHTDEEWSETDTDNSLFAYAKANATIGTDVEKTTIVSVTDITTATETFSGIVFNDENAYILNLRHLQNLDNTFSGVKGKKFAQQVASIENAAQAVVYKAVGDVGTFETMAYEFIPIVNSELASYKSNKPAVTLAAPSPASFHINGLKVTQASIGSKPGAGLFANVTGTAAIPFQFSDVRLVGATVNPGTLTRSVGTLAGDVSFATFTGCALDRSAVASSSYVGGLVGQVLSNATFTGCTVDGSTVTGKTNVGGLVGQVGTSTNTSAKAMFTSCIVGKDIPVTITVAGTSGAIGAGGLVGRSFGKEFVSLTATGCSVVQAELKGVGTRSCVGGLAGLTQGATFTNCTVGDYTEAGGDTVAGKITIDGSSTYKDPEYVKGKINSHVGSGGMIGQAMEGEIKLVGCTAAGDVSITGRGIADHVGGLVGYARSVNADVMEGCTVKGITVVSTAGITNPDAAAADQTGTKGSGHVGGMVGFAWPNLTLTGCTADSVTVKKEKASDYRGIGGLVGYVGDITNKTGKATLFKCRVIGKSVIRGVGFRNYVGGMVGYAMLADIDGNTKDVNTIDGCDVSVEFAKKVTDVLDTDTVFVGGIVGTTGLDYSGDESQFKNCKIANARVSGNGKPRICAGGFAGVADMARFTDCTADKINVTGTSLSEGSGKYNNTGGLGGFVGYSNKYIILEGCTVSGSTIADSKASPDAVRFSRLDAGGMLGSIHDNVTLRNCITTGTIVESSRYAGGMVAFVMAGLNVFQDCEVIGTRIRSVSPITSVAGGILGSTYVGGDGSATFKTCTADGVTLTATNSRRDTSGDITGAGLMLGAYAGGIVGRADNTLMLSGCTAKNVNAVSVEENPETKSNISSAGGIVGCSVDQASISGCKAINVAATSPWRQDGGAGGIAGLLNDAQSFTGCSVYWEKDKLPLGQTGGLWSVTPQITGRYAGGLVGRMSSGTISGSFAATFVSGFYSSGLLGAASLEKLEDKGYNEIQIVQSYADSVLGGCVKGGLLGDNLKDGHTITMDKVYAVVEVADWAYPNDAGTAPSAPGFAGLCNAQKGTLNVQNAYANLYDKDGSIGDVSLGGSAIDTTFTNCFWLAGDNAYMANLNGTLNPLPLTKETAKVALNNATVSAAAKDGEFTGPKETNPYLMSGTYPYPGLRDMPHYGDWSEAP